MADLNMLIDRVDHANHTIGQIKRRDALTSGANFRTVHVFLFVDEKLVLQRLPDDHPRSPNKLGSSVAGYVAANETYEEAAIRKLNAELRTSTELKWLGTIKMDDHRSEKFIGVFFGELKSVPKDFDEAEIHDLELASLDDLEQVTLDYPENFTTTFLMVFDEVCTAQKRRR